MYAQLGCCSYRRDASGSLPADHIDETQPQKTQKNQREPRKQWKICVHFQQKWHQNSPKEGEMKDLDTEMNFE